MIKFLRIFSFIVVFPAMIIFFYLILQALDSAGEGGSGRVFTIVVAFIVLFVPVSFNRIAWALERFKGKKI